MIDLPDAKAKTARPVRHVMTCIIAKCQYMQYPIDMTLVHDKPFQMRASKEWLDKIDDWRRQQPDIPSRAEAIRRLVASALDGAATGRDII